MSVRWACPKCWWMHQRPYFTMPDLKAHLLERHGLTWEDAWRKKR